MPGSARTVLHTVKCVTMPHLALPVGPAISTSGQPVCLPALLKDTTLTQSQELASPAQIPTVSTALLLIRTLALPVTLLVDSTWMAQRAPTALLPMW